MDGTMASLSVRIDVGSGNDQKKVEQMLADLRQDLLEVGADAVTQAAGAPPSSAAKAGGTSLSDVLIVSLSNSAVLTSVVHLLGRWVKRGAGRKITVRSGEDLFVIDYASRETEARLVESFIEMHRND